MLAALQFVGQGSPLAGALPLQSPMEVDPVLVGIIAVLLLVVLLLYLLVRRTVMSFTEGMREGRR